MNKRDMTGAVVDNILKLALGSSMLATILIAPNALKLFDKPVANYMKTLDVRARDRELRRIMAYMKHRQLIADHYEHGLSVTKKGRARLKKRNFDTLRIARPKQWDKKWRIVFFDIPEEQKAGRNALSFKLRTLGFLPLQKSVWIHPFPCREEITQVSETFGTSKYVTYLETSFIDNQTALRKRFSTLL